MRNIRRILCILIVFCFLICGCTECIPKAYAASSMTASESCIAFIKEVEGFSSRPYYDYNQYTVGYGTKCPTEKYFEYNANGISKKEADTLLRTALLDIENTINTKLIDKYRLSLSQHQFDALVSFSFNIGTGWMLYNSTLRNAIINNTDDNDLVYAFGLYCTAGGKYSPGLITRRLCEANMFLNGVYSKTVSDDYGYVYYDANGGSLDYRVQGYLCDSNSVPVADAVKSGDVFLGWYTKLTGGSQVTVLDNTLTGRTLFARWQSSEGTGTQNTAATTVTVTGDVVNIRSGPGTNYSRVRQVYRNDSLTVSHITHLTNMKWGKVQDGWVCLDYTNYDDVVNGVGQPDKDTSSKPSDQDSTPNGGVISGVVKVNDLLRIRSGPGTTYATVGFLFNGKKVEILKQTTVGSTVWGQIAQGWVSMDYVVTDNSLTDKETEPDASAGQEQKPEQEPADSVGKVESTAIEGVVTADALRIRSGASTKSSIIGFYYQNDVIQVSEKVQVGSSYWGKTDRGWINMDYVLDVSSNEDSFQPSGNDTKTVIGDCLRIRKDAGTNHKIVDFLYYGDTVKILETKTVDGTVWGRVSKGWISMDYVK